MSDVPTARAEVARVADKIEATHPAEAAALRAALAMMRRRAPRRVARAKSRPVDAAAAAAIRAFAAARPDMHTREIAAVFDCNPGRVSEALHHDR